MNEPPDPGGPGDMAPPAAKFITISSNGMSNESGMDTDESIAQRTGRKRNRINKICKKCNKKKRKNAQALDGKIGCCCGDSESNDSVDNNTSFQSIETSSIIISTQNDSNSQGFVSLARTKYECTDTAPFIVNVQRETQSPNDGITLHPVTFGKFLQRNAFHNIINGSVKRIGRNRISLAFSHFSDANSFISSSSLATMKLKAFIPSYHTTRMGVVRGVPDDWSPEEIIKNVTVPVGCGKILKVRRINRKTIIDDSPVWKPTQTIVITFDGQVLPLRIFICYNALPVEMYTYPTIQCYNCCRFGHTKIQCRSKPKCYKCGHEHTGDTCNVEEIDILCCHCSGSHSAISKICPEFMRQKQIKVAMSEKSISYGEAAKLFPVVGKSYANVVTTKAVSNIIPRTSQPLFSRPSPLRNSYKKTVFINRRSPTQLDKSYDREAHHKLLNEFSIPIPRDGCALNYDANKPEMMSTSDIIQILIETLTQSNIKIPSNVAPIINMFKIPKAANNGATSDSITVEL